MDLPKDPLTWNPEQVSRWLKSAFDFPEDTLQLFIQNDVDGEVLLADVDHEALKNEFQIPSFGIRCKIINQILALREPVATAPGHTATPIATTSDTQRTERRLRDSSPEEICLLEKPLKLRFVNVPTVRRQPLSPRWKQEKSSRTSLQHSNGDSTDGISIGASSFDDGGDHDDDDNSSVDNSNNSSNNDEVMSKDIDGHGSDSPDEEDEPLVKKLLERKENRPLATRILERKENEPLAKRVPLRKNLGHDTDIAPPTSPSLTKPTPHSAGSGSESGSKSVSRPTTTKRIAPTLVMPGATSSPSKLRSEPTTKQSRTTNKKQRRMKSHLAKIGLTLQDVFFNKDGSAFDSDDEDSFTVVKPRTARRKEFLTYQQFVQVNMRRILWTPPIFEVPGHVVYAPMRKSTQKDVPVRAISTALAGKDITVTSSTWDAVFKDVHKDPVQQRLTINIGDHDLTSINFAALTKGSNNIPPPVYRVTKKDDDIVYPLYGDSDASEYTTDEELYNEVAKEEKERQDKRTGRIKVPAFKVKLSNDAVKEISRIYISDRKETWARVERPKLGPDARKLFSTVGNNKNKQMYIERLEATIRSLSLKRLVALLEAMEETSYRNASEVRKACKSLDETVDSICHEQWKHDLLCGTEPIPDNLQNAESRVKSTPLVPKVRQGPERYLTSEQDSGETGAVETDDEAEERRQRELDANFIDDSEYDEGSHADIDSDESREDMDVDVSMDDHDTAKQRRSTKMPAKISPRPVTSKPATQTIRNVSATSESLSLPTPPFTATSPQDPPPLSDLDIVGEDVQHPVDDEDEDDDTNGEHLSNNWKKSQKNKKKSKNSSKSWKAKQAPSPICIDSDEGDVAPSDRPLSMADKSTKNKSGKGKDPVKKEPYMDVDQDGEAQGNSNPAGSVSPLETDMIPKSLVTNSIRDDGKDAGVIDLPQPATNVKPMKRPTWREELKSSGMTDDKLLAKLRRISKSAHLGMNVVMEEPYISAWQEYIEWVELDGGESIEFKEFLAWKDEGNTTQIYREKAREVAMAQAEVDQAAALKAKKERQAHEEQEVREEKEHASQEKNAVTESESSSQRSEGGKGKAMTNRSPITTTHPETITIDSSDDTDLPLDRLPSHSQRSTTKSRKLPSLSLSPKQSPAPHSPLSPALKHTAHKKRQNQSDSKSASESATDKEGSGSEARVLEKNLKKRTRIARNHFGEDSPEISSCEDSVMPAQPRPKPKRHKKMVEDEAEDVLILRQNAAKNEQEYQKRIKDQEQRARLRGTPNPLLGDETLINPGHKKTERAVVIPSFLTANLKPHQIDGLRFMWKNIVMFDGGCILAHSMGLGKTFQVVAFIYVLLTEIHSGNKDIPSKLQAGRVLLLMPPIVLQNWADEFEKWIPPQCRKDVHVYKFASNNSNPQHRIKMLEKWHADGGVFLMGYTMFRELSVVTKYNFTRGEDTNKRFKHLLLDPGPSMVFADEGHTIKNKNAKLSVAAKEITSTARVILTGYPLQNRLEEYWCMVDFVRPKFLDDIASFRAHYIRPISDGLHSDSTALEKKISSKKLKVLTELITNFVMRKDQSILRASLPKKYEFVISCKLSTSQYYMYTQILPTFAGNGTRAVLGNGHLLLTICNHPAAFQASTKDISAKSASVSVKSSRAGFGSPSTASASASGTITILEESDEEPGEKEKEIVEALSQNKDLAQESWFIDTRQKNYTDASHGFKVQIMLSILSECRAINEKVLVFSRSIPTLDFLEYITRQKGFKSLMLDGSVAIQDRQTMINDFNTNHDYDLFLISSGAGSQGVNLVSASRVIIFDVGWNPSHDEQAIARAFRYGQTRKVFVYRLHTFGTWEEKLYKTNLHKLGLSNRVVDKKNIFQSHSKTEMKAYFDPPPLPANNPLWVTDENVSALFDKVDTDDSVLRSVIELNKKEITNIVPQSELVREVDSDLTEADMDDIKNMIEFEETRIKWAEEHPGMPFPHQTYTQASGISSVMKTPVAVSQVRPPMTISAMHPPALFSVPGPAMATYSPVQSHGSYHPHRPFSYSPRQTAPSGPQPIPMTMMPQVASSFGSPAQTSSQRIAISMPTSTPAAGLSAQTAIQLVDATDHHINDNYLVNASRNGLGIQMPIGMQQQQQQQQPYEHQGHMPQPGHQPHRYKTPLVGVQQTARNGIANLLQEHAAARFVGTDEGTAAVRPLAPQSQQVLVLESEAEVGSLQSAIQQHHRNSQMGPRAN
ncbi:hypothetical protein BGZ96_000571 [Linnemannia gamsii]|uniref:Uncharacterized protein n=1 Tax=Linnemannia gamsii TaxID=64522 RepID=A0ABQ7K9W5_9FUNG|nr:hypothetical protein BGZ96_000571 [Linnemannia gamsii]